MNESEDQVNSGTGAPDGAADETSAPETPAAKPKRVRKPSTKKAAEVVALNEGPRNLRAVRPAQMPGAISIRTLGVETTRIAMTRAVDAAEVPEGELPMFREGMDWFVLRVASNKEDSVRGTLLRKVQIEQMEKHVGRIMVPTEKVKVLGKAGKHKITENKLYPGYVFVEMRLEADGRIPQDVFFLIKETTGVGDFVGTAGRPTPMSVVEVEKMLFDSKPAQEAPQLRMDLHKGDHVTVKDGAFQGYEGTIDEVFPDKGQVRVLVTIFGRQAPIDMEYWFVQRLEK